jgi:hypothetical protein
MSFTAGRKRLAFVSHVLPGFPNGQGVALARLLAGGDPDAYRIITSAREPHRPSQTPGRQHSITETVVYQCRTPWLLRRVRRAGLFHPWVFTAAVQQRARAIAKAALDSNCDVLIGCSGGDLIDAPATATAGTMMQLPVYLYYFDDYPAQWGSLENGWQHSFGTLQQATIEARLAPQINGIIVPNELLADDVIERLAGSIPVAVVRNAVDLAMYELASRKHHRTSQDTNNDRNNRPQRLIYSGTVYSAQADALENILRATAQLNAAGRNIEIHIYTVDADALRRNSRFPTHVVIHDPVDPGSMAEIQAAADVLLLPLSFNCAYPDLIRTSCPGKFGEYLASGTPMLIHAPPDSFPVVFANKHRCAQVCDTPDVRAVSRQLVDLLDDSLQAADFVTNALEAARLFDLSLNQKTFFSFVNQC